MRSTTMMMFVVLRDTRRIVPTPSSSTKLARFAFWASPPRRFLASLPAHMKITLPALSPTMSEGGLAKWKKKEGDAIKPGDVLCEVETDKATVDFEFQEEGTLAKRLVNEGTTGLKVGCVIGILVEDPANVTAFANSTFNDFNAEAPASAPAPQQQQQPQVVSLGVEKLKPATSQQPSATAPSASAPQQSAAPKTAPVKQPGERVFASPLARKLARELNKNLTAIQGSGPNGRILASDVREAKEAVAPAAAPGDNSWVMNKLNTPHYYLNVDVDLTEVLAACDLLNKSRKDKAPITVNDFIIRAAGLCMKRVPEANAAWGDAGAFRMYDFVDINVSVTAPESGEVRTALLKDVHIAGLGEVAQKLREISDKAAKGEALDESPGTFSIINVGEFGVRSVVPIIRPGQTTALGVGALRKTLIPGESPTSARVATVATITLSCDHRVVDGAIGADWLQNFRGMLEKPMSMLL